MSSTVAPRLIGRAGIGPVGVAIQDRPGRPPSPEVRVSAASTCGCGAQKGFLAPLARIGLNTGTGRQGAPLGLYSRSPLDGISLNTGIAVGGGAIRAPVGGA